MVVPLIDSCYTDPMDENTDLPQFMLELLHNALIEEGDLPPNCILHGVRDGSGDAWYNFSDEDKWYNGPVSFALATFKRQAQHSLPMHVTLYQIFTAFGISKCIRIAPYGI